MMDMLRRLLRDRGMLAGIVLIFLLTATANESALGSFVTYNDEASWQTTVGSYALEDFESYTAGVQIDSLPALGVGFDALAGGGFPATYLHSGTPNTTHGPMHLGNFPNGINSINQWDDVVLYVLPGYQVTALGFWNGDGQYATLTATVFDANDIILGSIGSYRGTFAGFISDTAIARVVFDGSSGDGWNHFDGLQTNASLLVTPEPLTLGLLVVGLIGLGCSRRERQAR